MTLKLLHIFENLVNFFLFSEYNLESDLVSSEPPVQHGPELPLATRPMNLYRYRQKSPEEVRELNEKFEISRFGLDRYSTDKEKLKLYLFIIDSLL